MLPVSAEALMLACTLCASRHEQEDQPSMWLGRGVAECNKETTFHLEDDMNEMKTVRSHPMLHRKPVYLFFPDEYTSIDMFFMCVSVLKSM